ncbi:MAG: lysylphosphatidylglycerol synthase transmembrane domain-containing protein [Oscillochloridaceae bacterium]|nr:flippase-like domain-containing protein [Chloroflexaceae bacterium]MDW8390621.1 lysylphosphatidylglycerol synthase transmembrane domain-containing protein [Oscillochloridaceae bacterium]
MRKVVVRALVTAVLLGWLFIQVDVTGIGGVFAKTRPLWLALAAVLNLVSFALLIWRWQVLLIGAGVRQPFVQLTRVTLISTFFSMFLPSSIGGDVVKMMLLAPDTARREAAISSVVIDRVVGMAVTIIVGIVAVLFLPVVWSDSAVIGTLAAATLIFVLGVVALFSRTLFRWMTRLTPRFLWRHVGEQILKTHQSLLGFRRQPGVLLAAGAISVLRQVVICVSVFCAGQAFGIAAGPLAYFATIPIALAITVLPVTISGLGLQDHAMVLLLATVGVAAAEALSLSIFLHVMRTFVGLTGGLWFAIGRRRGPVAHLSADAVGGTACENDHLQPVR